MNRPYVRGEERMDVRGSGKLTWDAGNGARDCAVAVRNISASGVQVVSKRALQPGWVAFLTGEKFECLGDVQYCRSTEEGYVVGMRFRREPYFRNTVAA